MIINIRDKDFKQKLKGIKSIDDKVFLTKTDTVIGFLSQNPDRLSFVKKRAPFKHYIKAVDSLQTLKCFTRTPNKFKNLVRRAKKVSFIMPSGNSYRVIKDKEHLLLLNHLKWGYTTSANLSSVPFSEDFARKVADIIIEPLQEATSSSATSSIIYKIGKNSIKRIR